MGQQPASTVAQVSDLRNPLAVVFFQPTEVDEDAPDRRYVNRIRGFRALRLSGPDVLASGPCRTIAETARTYSGLPRSSSRGR
jgi:hypothetical protein